jgi:hypothetical protein
MADMADNVAVKGMIRIRPAFFNVIIPAGAVVDIF